MNLDNNIEYIGDRYILYLNKYIGKGSFSTVYLGECTKTKLEVAIKKMTVDVSDKKIIENINNEISTMKIIENDPHPNIVKCYDIIKEIDKNTVYIVMEYCDCGDLRSLMIRPIKEKYVGFYFVQLVAGLQYLFSHNIVHRDIKPRNILVCNKRTVLKIADFGFAKYLGSDDLLDTVCGSPLYMSPEIIFGKLYNSRTDLWSIGMILYEMLYGCHPYQHCKNQKQLIEEIKTNMINIPPIVNNNEEVSDECMSLLKMLLQKNVDRRITWDHFFTHTWISQYEYVSTTQLKDTKNDKLVSMSFGSIEKSDYGKNVQRYNDQVIIDERYYEIDNKNKTCSCTDTSCSCSYTSNNDPNNITKSSLKSQSDFSTKGDGSYCVVNWKKK